MARRPELARAVSLGGAFKRDVGGSIVTIFAIVFPCLGVAVAGGTELAEVYRTKVALQNYVDGSALAGATQMTSGVSSAATERTRLMADGEANGVRPRWTVTTTATADTQSGSITVTQDAVRSSMFGNLVPPGGFHLRVTATATTNFKMPLCVLGSANKGEVVSLQNTSLITAHTCLVQSNWDLSAKDSSRVSAGAVHTSGGAKGIIAPSPLTDTVAIADPFSNLAISIPSTCKNENLKLGSGVTTLSPGVHCGNVQLTASAKLVLSAGEHYFTKGSFDVQDSASITGTDVVLFFKGQYNMHFKGSSGLWLEGRQSGPYAGFAIITDRSFGGDFKISTDNARRLHGTIYMPAATLHISGTNNRVADQSPWTVVVANKVKVDGSANLVMNTNYATSSIPVPSGVGPNGGARLSH